MIKVKEWSRRNIYYILAFAIPFVVAVTAFICQGMWPFGDRGVSIIDSYHQYVPFFSELQYKWHHGDSLLYSWNGGLGMNFWSVIAYYLASPLNLLLLIFPKSMVMECFALIYFIKIGLCGLTFAFFIRRRFGRYDLSTTVFGCCYALSSFVIGYGWNIMWLDCIVLFPLVMLGIYLLVKEGKGWLYGASLALCIFTNYYISIMMCIFSCLYLVVEMICEQGTGLREKIRRMFGFAGYSLLAGGFGAVMLMPTLSTLMGSQSAKSTFPTALKFYYDIFELFCQQFTMVEPTSLTGGFNLYCGVSMLIFVPMFVFNRKTKLWDRVVKVLLTAFLLVCLNTNYLTYIWHGFHFPNGLPGRYSFIFIFMILIMGYEGYKNRKYCPKWVPGIAAICWMGILGYCWWTKRVNLELYTWIINLVVLLIYGGLVTWIYVDRKKRKGLQIALMAVILVESLSYGIYGLCMNGTVNRKDYYSDQKEVMEMKALAEENEGENFYRMELEERRGRDDVTWHNIPGMSLFSSTVNAGVDNLMKRVGFYAVTNKYSYEGATPETDALLNIKYLISKKEEETIRTFEWCYGTETRNMYVNPYALGLGFMMSENILQWDYEKTNPFEVINQLVFSAADMEEKPFRYFGLPDPVAEGCELTTDTWADWSYSSAESTDGKITYTYTPEKEQDLYIYFKAPHCKQIKVIRGESTDSYADEDGHIIHVGNLSAGERVTLTFVLDNAYDQGTIKLIGAEHASDVFEKFYAAMADEQWITNEVTSTRVTGTIQVKEDGMLFTSIPYENGWTVKGDGEEVPKKKIADAFIGISLTAGEHDIEMTYMPEGLGLGLILTCISGVLFIILWFKENVHREK